MKMQAIKVEILHINKQTKGLILEKDKGIFKHEYAHTNNSEVMKDLRLYQIGKVLTYHARQIEWYRRGQRFGRIVIEKILNTLPMNSMLH
jgi:hypothetical protein